MAPIYFHFGHYPLVMDALYVIQDLCGTFYFFLFCFILLNGILFKYNVKYNTFVTSMYKTAISHKYVISLFSYLSSSFSQIKKNFTILFTILKNIFRN